MEARGDFDEGRLSFEQENVKSFRSHDHAKYRFFYGDPAALNLTEGKEQRGVPYSIRRLIVFTFFSFFVSINLEMGAISAAALNMQIDLNIDKEQLAFLFSISYFVCGGTTLLMPPAMNRFDAKTVLLVNQLLNAIGASMFVLFSDYRLLITGRVLCGFGQAFICSYTTVWIN